ncbi:MAG: dolichyl-phosphate beta-glucosyltransferase [Candidatus Berkelbacteria bacterium]
MTEKEYKYDLSIVVPAYNEAKRIKVLMEAIEKYVAKCDFRIETILVDNNSTDETVKIFESYHSRIPNLKVIEKKAQGKGGAVHEGMMKAEGDYILFTDADNSTPISEVDKLLPYAGKYDVIIGSRYCAGGKLAIPQPLVRVIGGRIINFIIQTLAVPGIQDTQCGFKMFQNKAAKEIFGKQTINGWSFDVEILAIARKTGYKIKEVGITWYDNPSSALSPIKDGLKMIADAWQVRKNIISGKYRRK